MQIKTVTVLGANGTMGCNVAGLFASFGSARVYMVCRDAVASSDVVSRAASSVRAGSIERNLELVGYDSLEECVSKSDIVFESVAEDLAAKMEVWSRVGRFLKPGTLACTGTSGLSIDTLAAALPERCRERFVGMHFFNPPYAMRLCELCPSKWAEKDVVEDIERYLTDRLCRIVVRVSDAPAFLGNRIGFELINRAMQLAEIYSDRGGVSYIDSILGQFTGRAMPPLRTADFVGLDVHKAIVDNVFASDPDDPFRESFALPAFCQHLVSQGMLGRKARGKGGLYRSEKLKDGSRKHYVYDIASGSFRIISQHDFSFADKMVDALRIGDYPGAIRALVHDDEEESLLCGGMLLEYIVYGALMAQRIGEAFRSADDVMAAGFNWCPPIALADALSDAGELDAFADKFAEFLPANSPDPRKVLRNLPQSKYDYRRYLRAIR